MPIVKTRQQAADILEVTIKTIGDWKKEPGFPARNDGHYDTDAIKTWRAAKGKQRAADTEEANDVSSKTSAAKLRILHIKEEREGLELEKIRGNLLPRELVVELIAIMSSRIRDAGNNLKQAGQVMPARMILQQMDLAQQQINDRIDQAIRDAAT